MIHINLLESAEVSVLTESSASAVVPPPLAQGNEGRSFKQPSTFSISSLIKLLALSSSGSHSDHEQRW